MPSGASGEALPLKLVDPADLYFDQAGGRALILQSGCYQYRVSQ